MTIILDNCPPSTLQGVGLGGRKNPRIIVGENSCHFGASYKRAQKGAKERKRALPRKVRPEIQKNLFSFLLVQNPHTSEGFSKGFGRVSEWVSEGFLKGFL